MALFLCHMCHCGLHVALWSHGTLMRLLAAEPRSIAGLLFFCQYLCVMILVTPYSIVRDWQVSRAEPMHFCWPSCSLLFYLLLFLLSVLSFCGFVLWSWALRTDGVWVALSRPFIAKLFWWYNGTDGKESLSIFTLSPENLLKDLESWRTCEHSLIHCFLGDAFGYFLPVF